jgi:low temperature requirement protein LtrA
MGLLHGALILAAIWWAWTTYAWLTSAIDVDEDRSPRATLQLELSGSSPG